MLVKFNSSVCRICLQSKASYNIFANDSISNKFNFVTLLEASKDDNLPENLCEKCHMSVRIAARIKKLAIATNLELKSYLKRINQTFLTLPSRSKFDDDESIADINVNDLAALYSDESNTNMKDNINNYSLTEVIIDDNIEYHLDDTLEKKNSNTNLSTNNDELKMHFDDDEYGDIEELIVEETNILECNETPIDYNSKSLKIKNESGSGLINSEEIYQNKKSYIKTHNSNYSTDEEDIAKDNLEENEESSDFSQIIGNVKIENSINDLKNGKRSKQNMKKHKKRRYVPDVIKASAVLNETESDDNKQVIGVINDTFRCGECDNTFTTKLNLDRHMEIHLNRRKSFRCETCNKLFTQLNSVREHMLTHTGEKPFKCLICAKAFSRRQIFKRHLNTHSKTKNYNCKECDQNFSVKRTLMLHINRVHGNGKTVEHQCHICSKTYRSKYTLSDHLQNIHNITL